MDNQNMALLSQIKDIRGLVEFQSMGFLPILLLMVLLLIILFGYWLRHSKRNQKKRGSVKLLLERLQVISSNEEQDTKKKLSEISEVLRLCAIECYGREASASLQGEEWLSFLMSKDINDFNWIRDASVLVESPYTPAENVGKGDVSHLIGAAEGWVRNHV